MSTFEFSFTFIGLVAGLAVVELVAGVGRLVHEGHRIRVGWLTPMLAIFMVIDVTTFWNQSLILNQNAPYSIALLMLGLMTSGLLYLAATLVFPREIEDGLDLDAHYWRHRRLIFSLVAGAKLLNVSLAALLMAALSAEAVWSFLLLMVLFGGLALLAGFLPKGRLAVLAFLGLLAMDAHLVISDVISLAQGGAWELGSASPEDTR
ncbi:MAG: hypothetical protein K2X61_08665 [Caulobacteraceae bacterium]|nr:hypothetical protein [Caulobacteraceae bacterium]